MTWCAVVLSHPSRSRPTVRSRTSSTLPNLIKIQLDCFDWFKREGLRELLDEISPIQDFTGSKMELLFGEYTFGEPKYAERVPRPRHDVSPRRSSSTSSSVKETGEIKEQELFMGDFPLMTDHRHVHHQRRRARRCLAARPLARRLLHDREGPDHGPRLVLRQAHPEPRRLARVRDLEPRRRSP